MNKEIKKLFKEHNASIKTFNGMFLIPVFFTCCLLALFFSGCKKYDVEDIISQKVLARVNDTVITEDEFLEIFGRLVTDTDTSSQSSSTEQKELKKNILTQLIEEELILAEAEKIGIKVSDAEVSQEAENMKGRYQNDVFSSTIISRYGSIEKWKEEIRRKILIRKTINSAVISKVLLKDDEISAYYREHKSEFTTPERVKARIIILETEEEAKKVLKRLRKGEDFTIVAKEVSMDRNTPNAGEFSYYNRGDLPKEFEDVLFTIPLGRASEVVKTSYGYNIFRVDEKIKTRDLTFPEVKKTITEKLSREKSSKAFQEWIMDLKNNAKIEIKEMIR